MFGMEEGEKKLNSWDDIVATNSQGDYFGTSGGENLIIRGVFRTEFLHGGSGYPFRSPVVFFPVTTLLVNS